jgi:succinoglycan biosynthesis transport protein ExoP
LNNEYQRLMAAASDNNDYTPSRPGTSRSDLLDQKAELEMDIQAARTNIRTLEGRIGQLNGSVNASASRSAAGEALMAERELANKEYMQAKEKYSNATDFTVSSSVNNFRVTVKGQPAIEPEPSKRKMIVALAGAAALVTSMLVIILLAYLDSSIKTPVIFSKTVGLKMISMINFTDLKHRSLADIVANKDHGENAAEKTRNNIFRESLRKLRYEIERSGKKVFLFTSTKKGQGKTTLIQALSYSMSMSKKRILIIDTNFCNNDLTVQLDAQPILEKIVPFRSDKEALMEQVKGFSKDLGVGTVYAIGSQGGDYTPSEILPRENILQHLNKLTSDFDYIFLEGPPLNDFSDSKELAQYVDGVIAVFSANHIIKQIDKQSITFFKELNGKFTGSILNMVDLKNVNVA